MKLFRALAFCAVSCTATALDLDDALDRFDEALTFTTLHENVRARLSGTLDLEGYHFQQPAPGLINSQEDNLFDPRLTLFLDLQAGAPIYFFVQSRVDRGFDPTDKGRNIRLDEYALRITPSADGRFNLQLGKFATVIGNWVPRHLSWDNAFITAPLIYENVTPIKDRASPNSPFDFVHHRPDEKYELSPVIWGPDYASGVSIAGRVGQFDYAAEMKNSSLSSHPASWNATAISFDNPSFDGRLGFRPNQAWAFGLSASDGAYLRPEAERTLPRGRDIGDYRELVLGQDVSFAWHHLQLWAEFYEARFEVPRVGKAETFAYYLEGKYKFTPQLFGALRWNQQFFNFINDGAGGQVRWSPNLGRIDVSVGYRFTSHLQLKLQYDYQRQTSGGRDDNHLLATQLTVRF